MWFLHHTMHPHITRIQYKYVPLDRTSAISASTFIIHIKYYYRFFIWELRCFILKQIHLTRSRFIHMLSDNMKFKKSKWSLTLQETSHHLIRFHVLVFHLTILPPQSTHAKKCSNKLVHYSKPYCIKNISQCLHNQNKKEQKMKNSNSIDSQETRSQQFHSWCTS